MEGQWLVNLYVMAQDSVGKGLSREALQSQAKKNKSPQHDSEIYQLAVR